MSGGGSLALVLLSLLPREPALLPREPALLCAAVPAGEPAVLAGEPSDLAVVGVIQVEPGHAVLDALLADLDRAGAFDLLVAERTEAGRRIAIHLRDDRRVPVRARADIVLDLTPDVIAFAVADVHPDPGAEVVLWGARGVFAWRPRPPQSGPAPSGPEAARFAKLFEADFLWQLPADGALFAWPSAVVDLDQDGLDDLVVPEPSGYRVAFQEREAGAARFRTRRLDVPRERGRDVQAGGDASSGRGEARAQRGERRLGVSFGDEGLTIGTARGPLLSVFDTAPVPVLADWDADSDLDLLAQTSREVLVFVQEPRGELPEHPTLALALPVERDLGRVLDVSYSTHVVEIDQDDRADCVVFASDPRARDVRSQGLVFTQRSRAQDATPLFGADGVPAQVLVFAGFVLEPRFDDVDRDGLADLVVAVLRPDLIDVVRAASSERIETELYAYRNQGGSFARRPDLVHTLSLSAEAGEHAARFIGDVTGDGLQDLCVREEPGRIAVLALRRTADGFALGDRPVWELAVDARSRLVVSPAPGRGPELLIVAEAQVLCASFPLISACTAALALGSAASGADTPVLVLRATERPGFEIAAFELADLDGARGAEIVLVGQQGELVVLAPGPDGGLVRRGSAVLADPARAVVDVAAILGPGAPRQVLVVGPQGAAVWRLGPGGLEGPAVLARAARHVLRLGRPTPSEVAADVNGDGWADVVVPGAERCELWLNSGALDPASGLPSLTKVAEIEVELDHVAWRDGDALSDVLAAGFTIPRLSTQDVNGDGRADLIAVTGEKRAFYLQRPDGTLPGSPDVAVDLATFRDTTPEAALAPGRTLAGGDRTHVESRDLDQDGIPDWVLAHRRKVWVFRGGPSGPQFLEPSAVLKSADDVTALVLARLDDDPRPDLLLFKVEIPGVATLIRGFFGAWRIEVRAVGYRASGGATFETTPAWRGTVEVELPSILSIVKDPESLIERFRGVGREFRPLAEGDFDGDGARDLVLVAEDSAALDLWLARPDGPRPGDEEAERILRAVFFEDDERVWDIDRVLSWMSSFAARRVERMTAGRPPDARASLRDPGAFEILRLLVADLDGDGTEEIVVHYRERAGGASVLDVLGREQG